MKILKDVTMANQQEIIRLQKRYPPLGKTRSAPPYPRSEEREAEPAKFPSPQRKVANLS